VTDWPTLQDYTTTRLLFEQRYPALCLKFTDLKHMDGYDHVTFWTCDGPRHHVLDLDEDDQVVLRPCRVASCDLT
jgi:hypothetical protein